MITIKQLSGISIETIHEAFAKAFADYVEPFDLSAQQLQYLMERRGYDPDLSFGAFDKDKLIGFTLNGTGKWNGRQTAYDTGTGIIKEYRRRGIAARMFNESLPVLKENKIEQYLLEVIQTNTSAYDLYKKAGFKVVREFDYFTGTKSDIVFDQTKLNPHCSFREISEPDWDLLKTCWDFEPSWQNSIDSVQRKVEYFKILAVYLKNNFAGYGIIELHSGDTPQLAVLPKFRKKGIASSLFSQMVKLIRHENIRIINSDSRDTAFKKLMTSLGLVPGEGQYEMLLEL